MEIIKEIHKNSMILHFNLNAREGIRIDIGDRNVYTVRATISSPSDDTLKYMEDTSSQSTQTLNFLTHELLEAEDRQGNSDISIVNMKQYTYIIDGTEFKAIDVRKNGSYGDIIHVTVNTYRS